MTSQEFINYYFDVNDGQERHCASVVKGANGYIYSYGYHYPLLFRVAGLNFRNTRGYSNTTGRHIYWTRDVQALDVELTGGAPGIIAQASTSDGVKLKELLGCLNLTRDRIAKELDAKKRQDTGIYRELQYNLAAVDSSIDQVKNELKFNKPAGTPKDGGGNDPGGLKMIAGVMALGNIFMGGDQAATNDWKTRMLKAGLDGRGLIMPDDWDQLNEDEKTRRLDGAIKELAQ